MMFRKNFACSLGRRLWPHTDLARKQLAHAVGVHGSTLDIWMQGKGSPSAEALAELVRFFHDRGDDGFSAEVFGTRRSAAPVAQLAADLKDMARRLEMASV
jgi:transcriptional regulator with XRE-family HTH domain